MQGSGMECGIISGIDGRCGAVILLVQQAAQQALCGGIERFRGFCWHRIRVRFR